MSKAIPNDGTYTAHTTAPMVVYVAETGSVCVTVIGELVNAPVAWRGKHTVTLINAKGEAKARSMQEIGQIFGVDMSDPFNLQDVEVGVHEFDWVGEREVYQDKETGEDKEGFKVIFMNPLGGGIKVPEQLNAADRKAVMAKFGSKFKALARGAKPTTASKPAAQAQTASKLAAPARSGPPSLGKPAPKEDVRVSTSDEAWTKLIAANEDGNEAVLGQQFFDAQDAVRDGAGGNMTPEEWGQVEVQLGL